MSIPPQEPPIQELTEDELHELFRDIFYWVAYHRTHWLYDAMEHHTCDCLRITNLTRASRGRYVCDLTQEPCKPEKCKIRKQEVARLKAWLEERKARIKSWLREMQTYDEW